MSIRRGEMKWAVKLPEGWQLGESAPKDRPIVGWDGYGMAVVEWRGGEFGTLVGGDYSSDDSFEVVAWHPAPVEPTREPRHWWDK